MSEETTAKESILPRRRSSAILNLALTRTALAVLGFSPLLAFYYSDRSLGVGPFKALALSLAKNLKQIFENAVVGEPDKKKELAEVISAHTQSYASFESWRLVIAQLLTLMKYFTFFIVILLSTRAAYKYHQSVGGDLFFSASRPLRLTYILLLLLVLPTFSLQFFMFFTANTKGSKGNLQEKLLRITLVIRAFRRWPAFGLLIYLIWLVIIHVTNLHKGFITNPFIESIALLTTLAVVFTIGLVNIVGRVCNMLLDRWKSQLYADSVIVVHLLLAAELLRSDKRSVQDVLRRRTLIAVLEDIALRFDVSLPRQLLGSNSSLPLKQDLAKIGNGVRALKRRIAIPNSNSWDEELRSEISAFLLNFVSLNWQALPNEQVESINIPTFFKRAMILARSLIIAAIPLIALFILQATPYGLTPERAEVAKLISLAWFALSIILWLDPEFSTKTKALKEIQELVTFKMKS